MTKTRPVPNELNFLAAGGELGARMRAFDWDSTPLGPAASWPRSLQTAVRIMLTCRQPMFVWWGESLINLYNDAYCNVLGGKHPSALGRPAEEVWREIWPQVAPRAASALLDDGTYDEALLLIMHRHGYPEETYYTFSYSPVPDDAGGTGGIICANTEETQRILDERQLTMLRELAAGTADARSVELACAQTADCLTKNPHDLPFALLYVVAQDGKSVTLAGSTPGLHGHPLVPVTQQLGRGGLWPLDDALATQQITLVDLPDGECARFPRGAWDVAPARAVVVPITAPGEQGTRALLIAGLSPYRKFDPTYRGLFELTASQLVSSFAAAEAYEQARRRAEALTELDRVKTAFFSNVSHEFRTPLTLMLGPTEDALASEPAALSGDALKTVYRNQLRLLKLVNTLLDFARIEAGRAQATFVPVDLSELTTDLASVFRSAVERAGVRFEVRCPPLPEPLFVDSDMWEKIVLNLLSNALKFTFEGHIAVSLAWHGDHAELTVEDTGTGIAEHELPRLFERFHRIDNARARTHEGSGIGLALVHELVCLHGGTIDAHSTLGEGTRFVVSVPRGSAHLTAGRVLASRRVGATRSASAQAFVEETMRWLPGEPEAATTTSAVALGVGSDEAEAASVARGAHVLVVDDNADMRDYLKRLLSPRFHVEVAPEGESALRSAQRDKPALIVSDVMMPILDGFGLLAALRANEATRDVPFIMLSARAGEEARLEGLRAGVDEYLVKPFSARELLASAEAQLARSKLRSVEEEYAHRMRAVFEHAPVGIAILRGPDLTFELANRDYKRLVGDRALLGKSLREAFPELVGQGIFSVLTRVYESGEPFIGRSVQVKLALPSGELADRAFDFLYQPLPGADGKTESVIVVAVDVTTLNNARREAESANRAKDEFLAMLGHELRNPLAPIVTALHLMNKRASGVAERERAIIGRQVDHLTRLVDDLLDISRITRGKVALKRERVELASAVTKALELASPLLERRHHQLALEVPATGLAVTGDEMRLAQVVGNLLTNAAKYTDPGGHIAVRGVVRGERVVLEVQDDGIGIAPEILPRVFETFVQERQAIDRSHGGLGLGLAIVRNLVEMHGGEVKVESPGLKRGSTFSISLPRARPETREASARTPAMAATSERLRLLLVDDNEDAAELLAEALRDLGHEVRTARDGPTALTLLERYRADACLLDVGLPVMDGYELAGRIRELPGRGPVQLVALTGYGQSHDRRSTRDAGFDEHLVKPVSVEKVEDVLMALRARG
ncbi:MAG: ATP-binding protein [Polyangiales bacterium]